MEAKQHYIEMQAGKQFDWGSFFSDNFHPIYNASVPEIVSICPTAIENKFIETTSWRGREHCAKQETVANVSIFLPETNDSAFFTRNHYRS